MIFCKKHPTILQKKGDNIDRIRSNINFISEEKDSFDETFGTFDDDLIKQIGVCEDIEASFSQLLIRLQSEIQKETDHLAHLLKFEDSQ